MKNVAILILCSFCIFTNVQKVSASHGTGGEITWECLGTGEYVFTLKFYRDCNGIPAPASLNILTTVPGVDTIAMTKISVVDISHTGLLSTGLGPCPDCSPATGDVGLIEEHIYESMPVTLAGIPPVQGWEFYWGECCRSAALTNIQTPGSVGFRLLAKMFSYNGQNADPCFDSSPRFIERPNIIACTSPSINYSHLAVDNEFDSLLYEYTPALDDIGNPLIYTPGYSYSSPLPGQNTLNPSTGEMAAGATNGGYFVTNIKVSSFKCGVKVAEIIREINVILNNMCPPILNGTINTPPVLSPPFLDSLGFYTLYDDTVYVGDTVSFHIDATDFQFFLNSNGQEVTFNTYGTQYGTNYTDSLSGCLIPPCATITPPPPVVTPFYTYTNFNWLTVPAHLGYSFSCVQFLNTYYFSNRLNDNYCPANATTVKVFSITVLPNIPQPPVVNNNGTLECNLGPTYIYQWFLNKLAIPGADSSAYTPVQNGTYQVLAVAPNGEGNYSDEITLNSVSLQENEVLNSIVIYPNPVKNVFAIEMNNGITDVEITDVLGNVILSDQFDSNITISVHSWSDGVYFIKLTHQNRIYNKRIIKQ